jgi:hypothetical protein
MAARRHRWLSNRPEHQVGCFAEHGEIPQQRFAAQLAGLQFLDRDAIGKLMRPLGRLDHSPSSS